MQHHPIKRAFKVALATITLSGFAFAQSPEVTTIENTHEAI